MQRHAHLRYYSVVIVSRASLILADTLLVYITWTKLSGRDAVRGIRQSKRMSLSDILFRGGICSEHQCEHSCIRLTPLTQEPYTSCTSRNNTNLTLRTPRTHLAFARVLTILNVLHLVLSLLAVSDTARPLPGRRRRAYDLTVTCIDILTR